MPYYFWTFILLFTLIVSTMLFWPWRKRIYLFISSIFGFSFVVIGLYFLWGSSHQLTKYYAKEKKAIEVRKILSHYKNTSEIIEAMKKAIAKKPHKAQGWYLLGRLYRAEKNYPLAASAFSQAYQLEPSNSSYGFEYLQCLYVVHHQHHTPIINKLIKQLKRQKPMNPALLDFLGYDAYLHARYENAIHYWEALLPYLENDEKTREAVLLAIGKAQKKLVKYSAQT